VETNQFRETLCDSRPGKAKWEKRRETQCGV